MRYSVHSGYCAEDVYTFSSDSSSDPLGDAIAKAKEIIENPRRTGYWVYPFITNPDNADMGSDGLTEEESERVQEEGF